MTRLQFWENFWEIFPFFSSNAAPPALVVRQDPQETFAPYGAGVKTSVVFLEKREVPLAAEGQQLRFDQEVAEEDEDYEVYMARIDDIGYDATGRLNVSEEKAPLPPEVDESIAAFVELSGWD